MKAERWAKKRKKKKATVRGDNVKMKKPKTLLILGIILFVGGIIAYAILMTFLFLPLWTLLICNDDIQFLIPGTVEIEIEDEGRYYVWNNYKTVYEGKSYSKPEEVQDNLLISLKTKDEALDYDIIGKTSISRSSDSTSRKSIGYFDITVPWDYILEVKGETEPRVFSFCQFNYDTVEFAMVLGIGGAVCLFVIFAGFALGVVGIVKMVKAKRG
jgi:hypothetical protein